MEWHSCHEAFLPSLSLQPAPGIQIGSLAPQLYRPEEDMDKGDIRVVVPADEEPSPDPTRCVRGRGGLHVY
jgi:hypothetical protein